MGDGLAEGIPHCPPCRAALMPPKLRVFVDFPKARGPPATA